jgi:Site-specific recombinase XerD
MYFTGLRVSNPLILTVRQIEELMQSEYGTELLINKQGKGKQPKLQTITLGEDARNLLVDVLYDDIIAILRNKSKQAAVFSEEDKETPLSRETWNNYVNATLKRASIKFNKNLRAHSFRITFATDGLKNQISLLEMKSMLSHKSVSTTQHYVRHELSKPELKNVITLANRSRVNQFHIKIRENQESKLQTKTF